MDFGAGAALLRHGKGLPRLSLCNDCIGVRSVPDAELATLGMALRALRAPADSAGGLGFYFHRVALPAQCK